MSDFKNVSSSQSSDKSFTRAYKFYRKLPKVSAITTILLFLAWGIIDYAIIITDLAWELDFGAVPIWIIIGLVSAAMNYFFTSLVISPTVVRTDAVLRIEKILNNKNSNSFSESDAEDLPEL